MAVLNSKNAEGKKQGLQGKVIVLLIESGFGLENIHCWCGINLSMDLCVERLHDSITTNIKKYSEKNQTCAALGPKYLFFS